MLVCSLCTYTISHNHFFLIPSVSRLLSNYPSGQSMASAQVPGSPSEFEEIEAPDATKTEETIAGLEPATDHDGEIHVEEAVEEADEVEAEEPPEEETKESNVEFTEEPAATPDEDENPLEEEED